MKWSFYCIIFLNIQGRKRLTNLLLNKKLRKPVTQQGEVGSF